MIPVRTFQAAVAAGAALFACSAAHADLKYTMTMTMLGDQAQQHAGQFSMSSTTYVKGGMQRQDSSMMMGPMQMGSRSLSLCDKQQTIQISDTAKVYTTTPLKALNTFMPTPPAMGRPGMPAGLPFTPHHDTPGTGTEDVTFTVEDLGPDTVNNIKAHHYMLHVDTKSTGCAGNDSNSLKLEVWVASLIVGGFTCPSIFTPGHAGPPAIGGTDSCHVTTTMHGDQSKLMDVFSHMMVKSIFYGQDGKPMMMNQISDYSAAPLADSTFDIPADYKQVSESDFGKAQQKAMMDQFRRMGTMGPQGGDNPPQGGDTTQQGDANGGGQAGDQNNGDQQPPKPSKPKFHLPVHF